MDHLSEGLLQAFLDGEVVAAEREAVAAHIERCSICADSLHAMETAAGSTAAGLRLLDLPGSGSITAAQVMGIGGQPDRTSSRPAWGVIDFPLLRAAMLVLAFGAVAAAALPGSPVRGWIAVLWQRELPAEVGTVAATPEPEQEYAGGVSILPSGGRVRILVERPAPTTDIRVRLVDGEHAGVRASAGLEGAVFRTGPGRIEVLGGSVGRLDIDLPRSAVFASVEVDGLVEVFKEGEVLRRVDPAAARAGEELTFRVGQRRD